MNPNPRGPWLHERKPWYLPIQVAIDDGRIDDARGYIKAWSVYVGADHPDIVWLTQECDNADKQGRLFE